MSCLSILADAPQTTCFSKVSVYISFIELCSGSVSFDIVSKKAKSGICKTDSTSELGLRVEIVSIIEMNGVIVYFELRVVTLSSCPNTWLLSIDNDNYSFVSRIAVTNKS